MSEENISQEFRLENIYETRNYLIEEIVLNELMSKEHRNVCTALNYTEHFLILASTITGRVHISGFASLVVIFIGTASSVIINYKSIIKKKKNKHDKMVLLANSE